MKRIEAILPQDRLAAGFLQAGLAIAAVLLATTNLGAQPHYAVTDGFTPPAIAPGSPAGSYALSGFDTVNMFNGGVNFRLPLLDIGGRGEAGYKMTLAIRPINWTIEAAGFDNSGSVYGGDSILPGWWSGGQESYVPGYMLGRTAAEMGSCTGGVTGTIQVSTLSRLTFAASDGTEYTLIDTQTYGAPISNTGLSDGTCQLKSAPRGTRFVSTDGSGLTFLASAVVDDSQNQLGTGAAATFAVSGSLYLPNGLKYEIVYGFVKSIRDRNGNLVTLTYENEPLTNADASTHRLLSVTDSLGRTVTITYGTAPLRPCDQISYRGAGNTQRTITVCSLPLGTKAEIQSDFNTANLGVTNTVSTLRTDFLGRQTTQQLFPNSGWGGVNNDTTPVQYGVVSSVTLPNNQTYTFQYNPYGEIAAAALPTGGAYEYDFGAGSGSSSAIGSRPYFAIYRRLLQRRIYSNYTVANTPPAANTPEQTVVYSVPGIQSNITVSAAHQSGATLYTEKHYFIANPLNELLSFVALMYSPALDGRETQTDEMVQDGQTVLRTVQQQWDQQSPTPFSSNPYTYISGFYPPYNPRVTQTLSTADGLTSSRIFCYDNTNSFSNQTDVYEYDFGAVTSLASPSYCSVTSGAPPATFGRHTQTTFKTDPTYTADTVHLWRLPAEQQVYDSSGKVADTTYSYDGGSIATAYSDIVGHMYTQANSQGSFGEGYTTRGNVTTTSRWVGSTTWVSSGATYDIAGNVRTSTDANGKVASYTYLDGATTPAYPHAYAFVTSVTDAVNHVWSLSYDTAIGKPTQVTGPSFASDTNKPTTTYTYNDLLDLLTAVNYPIGSATYSYQDSPGSLAVTASRSLNSSGGASAVLSATLYDGLGRVQSTQTQEPAGKWLTSDRQYDSLGRPFRVSNPYEGQGQATVPYQAPSTDLWTTTAYDALSRAISVTTPDGASTTTSYSGSGNPARQQAVVTDPSGASRTLYNDALGRLTRVIEAGLYQTDYTYDGLDDLTGVTQSGGPVRSFSYDALKRLVTANNPESGQTAYSYDSNGNLLKKTDSRSAITNYTYDALNRILSKTYDLTQVPADQKVAATPNVTYIYDQDMRETGDNTANFPVGRLSQVNSTASGAFGASAITYTHYDALGRVTASRQDTGATPYKFTYTYNDQVLETVTYPSRARKVQYIYDSVGRVQQVKNLSATGPASYATGMQYAPQGALQQMTLGNNLVEQTQFNNRLQPCAIRVGTSSITGSSCPANPSPITGDLLNLVYNYGTTANNGNLLSQQIVSTDPAQTLSWTQQYGYDTLNRLISAGETLVSASPALPNGVTANNWSVVDGYGAYGNRWQTASWAPGQRTPTADNQFSTVNNRIVLQADGNHTPMPPDAYDHAGNLMDHPAYGQMQYDAENRLGQYTSGGNVAQYGYDGDGRRVQKTVSGSQAYSTTFVYDASGELAAEYSTAAPVDSGTTYLTGDHLGSTRLVTNGSGGPVHRFDYFPYGEDLSGFGNRNLIASYNPTGSPTVEFTGKERDGETGLDYFGARYFSGAMGRFTSPDPHNEGAQLVDPQSWNMYSYVRNSPLRYVDPDGQDYHVCIDGQGCQDMTDAQWDEWRTKYKNQIYYSGASGRIEDLDERKIGSATWFDGDAVRRIDNAMGLLNFFVVNQSINMATEGLGAWVAGLRAGASSRAAFQGGIRLQGAVAERIAGAQLALKGYRIVGRQVRVLTSAGERVVDFIVERAGEYTAIEVKSGEAVRDAGQLAKDAAMSTEGGLIKNGAGGVRTELTGQTMKLKTIEVRPF